TGGVKQGDAGRAGLGRGNWKWIAGVCRKELRGSSESSKRCVRRVRYSAKVASDISGQWLPSSVTQMQVNRLCSIFSQVPILWPRISFLQRSILQRAALYCLTNSGSF